MSPAADVARIHDDPPEPISQDSLDVERALVALSERVGAIEKAVHRIEANVEILVRSCKRCHIADAENAASALGTES